jgi:hypothetical protein
VQRHFQRRTEDIVIGFSRQVSDMRVGDMRVGDMRVRTDDDGRFGGGR